MPRPAFRPVFALAILLLAGCTTGDTGGDTATTAAPDPISVSALPPAGDAVGAAAQAEPAPEARPAGEAITTGAAVTPLEGADEATERTADTADPASDPAAEAASEAPEAAPPPPPLSPAALACQKKGGMFVGTGQGDLRACVQPTGEGTRRCTKQTECKGQCLAQSGTCAPITPLFGCNDVLQADGRRVTLCIN